MADTERLQWRKSISCESSTCVEVARTESEVLLRDGKDPDGPRLLFTHREWVSFLDWTRSCAA